MKPMNVLALAFIIGFLLSACEAPFSADLKQAEDRLVVNASVLKGNGPHTVSLTRSTSYTDNSTIPIVTGAIVMLADDAGQLEELTEQDPGKYVTTSFQGIVGRTYTLTIVTPDGKSYTAAEKMEPVPAIASLSYRFISKQAGIEDEGYYMTLFFTDPANQNNYYRVKFLANGIPVDKPIADWLVAKDKFANGSNIGVEILSPYRVTLGQNITLQLLSLTEAQWNFYNDAVQQANSAGSPFGPPATNPRGNISNGALGIFNVSDVSERSILIQQ